MSASERSLSNGERMIDANGVDLCVDTFGRRGDPAILLIHGACASMLWWEAELCTKIAGQGRFVIRYDNRDTGRSTSYPPGEPGYALSDVVNDALAILDHLGVAKAHVVGRSMAGAIALALAVDHPERVLSLTIVTASTGDDQLPDMSDDFIRYTSTSPDYGDPGNVSDWIVGLMSVFSGGSPYFDEFDMREIAEQDVARTINMESALTNHFRIDFDAPKHGGFADIKVPTLIVHGEHDQVFPLAHGEALRDALDGARLLVLPKAGHEVPRPLWDMFADALVQHTAAQVS